MSVVDERESTFFMTSTTLLAKLSVAFLSIDTLVWSTTFSAVVGTDLSASATQSSQRSQAH